MTTTMTGLTSPPPDSTLLHQYNREQRDAVTRFRSILGCSIDVALKSLQSNEWDVSLAVDSYTQKRLYYGSLNRHTTQQQPAGDYHPLTVLFDRYADVSSFHGASVTCKDTIYDHGIELLCRDLGLDPESGLDVFTVCWLLRVSVLSEITREEWWNGWQQHGCTSLEDMQRCVTQRTDLLQASPREFRELYSWLYDTLRSSTSETRNVITWYYAVIAWRLLLPPVMQLWQEWLDYCVRHFVEGDERGVTRDLWMQLLEFGSLVKADLSNYNDNDSWPSKIDDFVEELKELRAQRALAVSSSSTSQRSKRAKNSFDLHDMSAQSPLKVTRRNNNTERRG